jgi:hypothetical protein
MSQDGGHPHGTHTQKPVSQKQLAANRANAARSTGPRTPLGKACSAQNARKHGFTAATFAVVRLEDLDQLANLRADLIAAYQPANSQELFAIERIILAQQSLPRAARLEAGLFTTCLNESLDSSGRPVVLMSPDLVGDGDIEITRAQAERHYRRAIEEFKGSKPCGLNYQLSLEAQPEPKEDTCPLSELNPFLTETPLPPPMSRLAAGSGTPPLSAFPPRGSMTSRHKPFIIKGPSDCWPTGRLS